MPNITDTSIKMAVEIVVAGMPLQTGTYLNNPEAIAKFLEVVATKLEKLRTTTAS